MNAHSRWMIALALLLIAALACSIEFSTAHFDNPKLVKDPANDERARTFAPDDTFYCVVDLVDTKGKTPVRAVWSAVTDGQETVIDETELDTTSGPLTFEAAPPETGWAKGSYRLTLYLDGEKQTTVDFTVK